MAVLKKDVGKNARVDDDTRMTKTKLIQAVSKRTGIDASTVRAVYAAIVDEIITTTRSGRSVMLTGFGRFYRLHKAGHTVQFTKSGMGAVPGLRRAEVFGLVDAESIVDKRVERVVIGS